MAVGVPRSAARSLLVALHTLRWVWVASSWPSQVLDLNGCEQRRHREVAGYTRADHSADDRSIVGG
jgi:hypothetical protein